MSCNGEITVPASFSVGTYGQGIINDLIKIKVIDKTWNGWGQFIEVR